MSFWPYLLSLLGIQPIGETVRDTAADARGFLGKICSPAAEQFGYLLEDKVKAWRGKNFLSVLTKARKKHTFLHIEGRVNPRIAYKIIEESSLCDSDVIQDMWAGLLVSSTSADAKDESNLIFVDLLSRLNTTQCLILNYSCENSKKTISKGEWIFAEETLLVSLDKLRNISGIFGDDHRIDRELDYLRAMELIRFGFYPDTKDADLTPSPLGLQLYVRSQGYIGSPLDYFGIASPKDIILSK